MKTPRFEIASPCNADWSKMRGDERVRFCALCKKNVFNLSAMTTAEVQAFEAEKRPACVRFFQRADGTVLTSDCPVGLREKLSNARSRAAAIGGAICAALLGVLGVVGATEDDTILPPQPQPVDWTQAGRVMRDVPPPTKPQVMPPRIERPNPYGTFMGLRRHSMGTIQVIKGTPDDHNAR